MRILVTIAVLCSFALLPITTSLNVTVCDCSNAEIIGLMGIDQPYYCKSHKQLHPVLKTYRFFVRDEPHASWKAFLCKTWIKEKKIDGFFFGGYDTTFSTAIAPVSERDCWDMVQTRNCAGNSMITTGNTISYTASPTGEGRWMQSIIHSLKNCIVQEITLRKDCVSCAISSPFGTIANQTEPPLAFHNDATIVWKPPKAPLRDQCFVKLIKEGAGTVTLIDRQTSVLVDHSAQLEFIYHNEPHYICNNSLLKLKNVESAYLQLLPHNWTHIFSLDNNLCLSPSIESPVPCRNVLENSLYLYNGRFLAIKAEPGKPPLCFSMAQYRINTGKCDDPLMIQWDPNTFELKAAGGCLEMNGNASVSRNFCTGANSQKWMLGTPPDSRPPPPENKPPLLSQHHQFIEDQAIKNENIIENELKAIYCSNLQVRRFTTTLLAETNGLTAALANNLPLCHRLKPSGPNMIVQKCTAHSVTVGAKLTNCGYEPLVDTNTIGRDGYSLHPFQDCFWKDGLVNLNGKTYYWKNDDWIEIQPTHHLSTLRLTSKFTRLADNEFRYQLNHHDVYKLPEFEQVNTLNELATRIHDSNADALSSLVLNAKSDSRFWNISHWTTSLKTGLYAAIGLTSLLIFTYAVATWFRGRSLQFQNDFESFALTHQEERRQLERQTTNTQQT